MDFLFFSTGSATPVEVLVMTRPCTFCECDDRDECGCPQECVGCHETVHLVETGMEWGDSDVRCWGCQDDRIKELTAMLQRVVHGDWCVTDIQEMIGYDQ